MFFKRNALNEECYQLVSEEISSDFIISSLWAKAIAKSNGDHEKALSLYIQYRVKQIKLDTHQAKKHLNKQTKEIQKEENEQKEKFQKDLSNWADNEIRNLPGFIEKKILRYGGFWIGIIVSLITTFITRDNNNSLSVLKLIVAIIIIAPFCGILGLFIGESIRILIPWQWTFDKRVNAILENSNQPKRGQLKSIVIIIWAYVLVFLFLKNYL